MELTFDNKGNLTPYSRIEITIDDFEAFFVSAFDNDSTRKDIFEKYQKFISDFEKEVTTNFVHWVNGSFVTNKFSPRDIDFVTLISHSDYVKNRELIDSKFRLKKAKEIYKVDAYTIEIYPEGHSKHLICKSDLVYWDNWFSRTKKNRMKKSFPKGYIEIKFN